MVSQSQVTERVLKEAPSLEGWNWLTFLKEAADKTMDLDRKLFQAVKEKIEKPTVRFYAWKNPTISYGRTQGIDRQTERQSRNEGWEKVMRPTGGGKVIHKNDLCFSVLWRKENGAIPWKITDSYFLIHLWIQKSLNALGFPSDMVETSDRRSGWCFKSAVCFDLAAGGDKIVGGAQWRDGGA